MMTSDQRTHLDDLENQIFGAPDPALMRRILDEKREVAHLCRIVTPERDVVSRLARREFLDINTEMSFRFRDIYDHLVRVGDDAMIFQDRITGMLDTQLTNASNRLNEVMKVLTIISTIFIPLNFIAGVYGMNFDRNASPLNMPELHWYFGYPAVLTVMGVTGAGLLVYFKRKGWF